MAGLSLAVGLAGLAGSLAAVAAWREARRAGDAKGAVFDACRPVVQENAISLAPDGYPRLSGIVNGRDIVLALMPDTLTIKRLPQLWLTVSMASGYRGPALAVVARPRGDEFLCAASRLPRRLAVPDWLPADSAVRSADGDAASVLDALQGALEPAFCDPCVKELSLGRATVRAVYRLAEGARGAHLLLRQARFDARLEPETLARLCAVLVALDEAAMTHGRQEAA